MTTETNAERLERMKNINDLKHIVALRNPPSDSYEPSVDLESDIDWIIEQAERAQELEKEVKRLKFLFGDIGGYEPYSLNNYMQYVDDRVKRALSGDPDD